MHQPKVLTVSFLSLALITTATPALAQKKDPEPNRTDWFKPLPWRSVGPANMGGRLADIALSPSNPKTFFLGFGTSGLWKTTNMGTTFTPVFDKEATSSIGSVVVCDAPANWSGWKEDLKDDPEPPTGDKLIEKGKGKIVWVGTGEGNGRNSSSWGHGVYRSTDGGTTFKNVGLDDSHDIPRLAVDPRNPDVCYAAALGHLWGPNKERGVYKTEDAGKSWKPVLQIDENTGAIDVLIDPSNPDTVYAAMYMRLRTPYSFTSGGPKGGIYKSTDAGRSWKKVANGLPAQTGRIGLDLYKKDTKELFALVESDEGGGRNIDDDRSRHGGLFKSTDGGNSWTRIHGRVPRAFYFSKVRVDPTDDKRIYILGYGIDYSDDGGATFHTGMGGNAHGDCHVLVVDPTDHDHLLLGDDGGLFQSFDRGKTWSYNNTIAVGEFYEVAYDMQTPYRLMGGLQDNGSWMGPSSKLSDSIFNADWKFITDSDGFHCAFDPEDPNIFYTEGQGADLYRTNFTTGKLDSITPVPKEGSPRFRFNWNSPLLVSKHHPKTLYVAGNYVFKLLNRGDDWEKISPDLTKHDPQTIETTGSNAETYGTVVSLCESSIKPGLLWTGSDDGMIYLTEDDGKNWRDVTPKEVAGHYISKIEASHSNPAIAYVTVDAHRSNVFDPMVLMTEDSGKSWKNITGDLPKGWSAMAVREDAFNPGVIYVGTQAGMFFTYDKGKHWVSLNGDSLPTVPVYDIQQHPRERDLILATHGRSIYEMDDASPLSQMSEAIAAMPFHVFDVRPGKPQYGLWEWTPGDQWFKGKVKPSGANIDYWLKPGETGGVSILIETPSGVKVRELTGTTNGGLNRVTWDLLPEQDQRVNGNGEAPGEPIFVPPGDYKVTVTHGKLREVKTLKVLPAPGKAGG